MIRPGSSPSRILAVACLGFLVLFVIAAIVAPLSTWRSETFAARMAAIKETERLKQDIAELKHEAGQLSSGGVQGLIWSAKHLGEATARIQARVGDLAQTNALVLRSIAPAGERQLAMSRAVVVHVEVEAALDKLRDFLIALEYHKPGLTVERAGLRRLARPGPSSEQPLLFVQLDILAPVQLAEEAAE